MTVEQLSTGKSMERQRCKTEHRLAWSLFRAKPMHLALPAVALFATLLSCSKVPTIQTSIPPEGWQEEFNLSVRKLEPTGEAKYFILIPGYQLTLESQIETLVVSVTAETRDIGGITTRMVEEREHRNGELFEISRNYYAIDPESGDVFYFGE